MRRLKVAMIFFQIFLILNINSFSFYQLNEGEININPEVLDFVKDFFSIKQIGIVSATHCCEKTLQETWCQFTTYDQCDENYKIIATSDCSSTNFCKSGWCTDNEGLCSISSETQCEEENFRWSLSEGDCIKGCCKLGPNTQYRERSWCEKQGGNFEASISIESCVYYSPDVMGACLYDSIEKKVCEYISEEACSKKPNYDFTAEMLCSNKIFEDILEEPCEPTSNIGCYNEKLYWYDSCGNRENIYEGATETDKTRSWNNGVISSTSNCNVNYEVSDSNPNSPNNCGNCDRTSNICKAVAENKKHVEAGNFVCQDLGCDEDGDGVNERRNGESWCMYEGRVGEYNTEVKVSSDIPGSSHYKKECNQGEISVNNCDVYRKYICAEDITQVNDRDFSSAECRINNARNCYEIENEEDCEAESDCRMQSVNAADYFKFKTCVPKYPLGFNPKNPYSESWDDGEFVCNLVSAKCEIIKQKEIEYCENPRRPCGFKWVYLANKNCEDNPGKFYNQMNDLCVSIGDCGGYINTEGDYTGNNKFNSRYNGFENVLREDSTNNPPAYIGFLPDIPSPGSVAISFIEDVRGRIPSEEDDEAKKAAKQQGLTNLYYVLRISGMILGFSMGGGAGALVAGIGSGVEFILRSIVGEWGQIERSAIRFNCAPWEPPIGNDNCDKCGKDGLPCTEYKCWSLGSGCGILHNEEGVQNEKKVCVQMYSNPVEPLIEFKDIEEGYTASIVSNGISVTKTNGSCVEGNSVINISLVSDKSETDKYAKCRYGEDNLDVNANNYKSIWNDMPHSGTTWAKEHEFTFVIPYYENQKVQNGEYNLYVRCESNTGKANVKEYVINFCVDPTPDITAPVIKRFEPANNARLKYGENKLSSLSVYTNEPVNSCKYSTSPNTPYENMNQSLICDDETPKVEYECNFNEIDGLDEEENKLYFKCNDTHGNIMTEDKEFLILKSIGELDIIPKEPMSQKVGVGGGAIYTPLELVIETLGGANGDGISECYWNYSWGELDPGADNKWHIFYPETNSNKHKQAKLYLVNGGYNIPIKCEDKSGNIAYDNIIFNLQIDNLAPEIATIFKKGNKLIIKTYEESRCYYNTTATTCEVPNIGNSETKMESGISASVTHEVAWDINKIYHVQCQDQLKNFGACVTISPSEY